MADTKYRFAIAGMRCLSEEEHADRVNQDSYFQCMFFRYGGITFLSAYLILLVVVGVPLYVLEIVLGQYSSAGPRSVFSRMAPVSSGIGTAMLLVLAFTVFTYNLPVAWIIFFTAASFNRSPPWGECGHEYNSPSVLFFVMLITMGLDSQFTMVEMLSVAVVDEWPRLRPQRHWISMGVCAAFLAANLCMCLDGGVRVFVLFDHFAFSFSQFAVALLEILAVGWAFGAERVLDLMSSEMKIPMSQWVKLYWRLAWRFAAPVVLVAILGSTVAFHGRVSFTAGDTRLVFQPWEDGIGLVLMLAPAVLVVLTALQYKVLPRSLGHVAPDVDPRDGAVVDVDEDTVAVLLHTNPLAKGLSLGMVPEEVEVVL
ncbi:Sodium-dependent dopamine transporter [Amphibalanus amphitrite]|uniref:Sodium-dependent dopamine transporter n=1 Tax=Amphibalanus amphitrite TaxID=1232801 RepID=A0A6A4W4I6_AMPAM|nr:Sodium-dependent dopamine transporter [Amphibalanus amphitrite]